MGLAALIGAAAALEEDPGLMLAGATCAVLLLAIALASGFSGLTPFAVVLLGAVYAIPEGERAIPAPVYGAGLLLCAELAYWSLELRVVQRVHGDVVTPRLLGVLAVAGVSLAAGALVLLAAGSGLGRSPATTAAAALAVGATAGLLALLARAREAGHVGQP